MLFDLNEEMLQKAAAELGDNAIYHAGDVADEVSVAAALESGQRKIWHGTHQCELRRNRWSCAHGWQERPDGAAEI